VNGEDENLMTSVIVPVRNGARYLSESLKSLTRQTFTNFEVIVVDDNSDDRSKSIAENFRGLNRITVVSSEGLGPTDAINTGVARAQGAFIARQDADDISLPERLERQMEFMRSNHSYALVGTYARVMDENGADLGKDVGDDGEERPYRHEDIRERLPEECCIVGASVVMRKDALLAIGGYRRGLVFAEDYDLWLRMMETYRLAAIPEYLYSYRRHSESMWRSRKQAGKLFTTIVKDLHMERLREGSDVIDRGGTEAFLRCYLPAIKETLEGADLNYVLARLPQISGTTVD